MTHLHVARPAHYEINYSYSDDMCVWYWWFRVKAQNGKILAHSETYRTKRACLAAIRAVQNAASKVKE